MSEPAATTQRQEVRQQGVIASLVTLPFRIFGILCGSLLIAIIIECVGMHFFWPDESWHHSEKMLEYELSQLSTYFTESLLMKNPSDTAHRWVSQVHDALFVKSGVVEWARETSAHAEADVRRAANFRYYLSRAYLGVEVYVMAASYTLLTFLVRLIVLCLTLPLFLMGAFVGLIDGLARRDIRRFGAGRESGFIYHRARAAVMPLAVMPWVCYLAMPISIHPLWILMPSAVLLSAAVNITAGSFKKYL